AAQVPAPVEAAPATAPPAETPMMPATGAPMAPSVGAAEAGPADRRAQGVSFGEARHRPLSRMRSDASRQELLNRAQYGEPARVDPQEQRRAVDADPDSPLTPSDNTVVPGVITGGAPEGPHDSGPVLTGTAYRHYPEYYEPEPEPEEQEVYEEEYEDGSSVAVEYAPPPKDDAVDEPDPAPAENRSAVDRAEAAESETESRLFATRLQGKDFLDALRNLPGGKAKEFIAAQRALREAEDAEGGASPDAKAD
ncbi:MAG: hypothetical protein ACRDXX_18160, partial [Stackebrandtia sp.]